MPEARPPSARDRARFADLARIAAEIAVAVGDAIAVEDTAIVTRKRGRANFATAADHTAERTILARLGAHDRGIPVLTEESPRRELVRADLYTADGVFYWGVGARKSVGVDNVQPGVVDALLRGAFRQTKERIVNDLAIDLDRLSLPGERDVAALTDCRKASLMRDADAFDRRINEEDAGFADSPRERSRQLHT